MVIFTNLYLHSISWLISPLQGGSGGSGGSDGGSECVRVSGLLPTPRQPTPATHVHAMRTHPLQGNHGNVHGNYSDGAL